jgi:predicted CXXCH cytochrome family protein
MVRRIIFLASMTALVLALTAGSALGYSDYIKILSKQNTSTASVEGMYALGCMPCHGWDKIAAPNNTTQVSVFSVRSGLAGLWNATNVPGLSASGESSETWLNLYEQYGQAYGPHGGYSNTTDRCKVCHDVHAANGDKRLLPQDTVAEICETCHDFTQGISIYGAIKANGGTAKGAHWIAGLNKSIDDTSGVTATTGQLIPGGQLGTANGAGVDPSVWPLTGGTTAYSAAALASGETALTCTDCHTPHGNTSMKPFKGDRVRLGTSILTTVLNVQPARITRTQFAVPQLSLPADTDVNTVVLALAPDSPVYGSTDAVTGPSTGNGVVVNSPGLALALSLIGAGVLDVKIETTTVVPPHPAGTVVASVDTLGALGGSNPISATNPYLLLKNAYLTRTASNKLLRDYINGVDMRTAALGGTAPANNDVTYNQTLAQWNPVASTDNELSANAPWNNGQNNASAEYGSAFCYSCHQGRLGNTMSGTNGAAVTLDTGVAALPSVTDNALTAINHPTNMRLPYRSIGGLTAVGVGFFAQHPSGIANGGGWMQGYGTGLALSNAGYTMYPVQANPNGRVTDVNRQQPGTATSGAPICQQCHEDFRDVETAFDYSDTDKDVPFSPTVNGLIGATGNTIGGAHFIQAGNPLFQNFPHETANLRMLVEGGDSAQVGGGNNDDLCLNCHVPGSTVRILDGKAAGAKNLKGFME